MVSQTKKSTHASATPAAAVASQKNTNVVAVRVTAWHTAKQNADCPDIIMNEGKSINLFSIDRPLNFAKDASRKALIPAFIVCPACGAVVMTRVQSEADFQANRKAFFDKLNQQRDSAERDSAAGRTRTRVEDYAAPDMQGMHPMDEMEEP